MAALTARTLVITIGGTDYSAQVMNAEIQADDADSDDITFAEAAAGGGRQYTLAMKIVQDLATTGLWDKVWSVAGTDLACLLKPYGNAAASTTQPHYSFSANVREPNGVLIGGDADASPTKRQTIEVEWPLAAKPTKVVV